MFFLKLREKFLASRINAVKPALDRLIKENQLFKKNLMLIKNQDKEQYTYQGLTKKYSENLSTEGRKISQSMKVFSENMSFFSTNIKSSNKHPISRFFQSFFCPNSTAFKARKNAWLNIKKAEESFNNIGKTVRSMMKY